MITNLPGNECLGRGYNIFGEYASPTSTTSLLFELGPEETTINLGADSYLGYSKDVASYLRIDKTQMLTIFGETIDSYLNNIKSNIQISGSYKAFSGSAEVNFERQDFQKSNYQFTTIRTQIQKFLVRLQNPGSLKLTKGFKQDLANTDASQLFKKYGTHYVSEYIVGGKLEYSYATDISKFTSNMSISVIAELSFNAIVGSIELNTNNEYKTQIQKFQKNSKHYASSTGGDPIEISKMNSKQARTYYEAWCDSVNKNFTMCDFTNRSLIPIWQLCETQQRKNELEKNFVSYAQSQQLYHGLTKPIQVSYTYDLIQCGNQEEWQNQFNCFFYKPNVGIGEYWLGHYVTSSSVNASLPVIKALDPSMVNRPHKYQRVWSNLGPMKSETFSVWNPIPPQNYVALGCILKFGVDKNSHPSQSQVKGLVCLHKSVVTFGLAGDFPVWSDQGSGAYEDCSIWPIVPKDSSGLGANCFYASNKNKLTNPNPCYPTAYVLDINRISLGTQGNKQKIVIKYAQKSINCGSDTGLHSSKDLTYFKPDIKEGEYWFGHTIIPKKIINLTQPLPITTSHNLVARPISFKEVWSDKGSKRRFDYACWWPIAPPGYVSLGFILKLKAENYDPPSGDEIEGLVCVKKQFCTKGEASGRPIWTDAGSGANMNLSLYEIIPSNNQGFNMNYFYAQTKPAGYPSNPTDPQVWVLKTNSISLE